MTTTSSPATAADPRLRAEFDRARAGLIPLEYRVLDTQVVWVKKDEDRPIVISRSAACVTALIRTANASYWSVVVVHLDPDGNLKQTVISLNEIGNPEVIDDFRGNGLLVVYGQEAEFRRFMLASAAVLGLPRLIAQRTLGFFAVPRAGSDEPMLAFAMPDRCLVPTAHSEMAARLLFQPPEWSSAFDALTESGELAEWYDLAARAGEFPLFVVAYCFSLAAPLLELAGIDNFIIHVWHDSSKGKTTSTQIAVSAWGCAADPQRDRTKPTFLRRWTGTPNGMEAVTASCSGLLLGMDDLGSDTDAMFQVFRWTGGVGKMRMNRRLGLVEASRWSLATWSNGETSMSDRIQEATSRKAKTGEMIRAIDVPAAQLPRRSTLSEQEELDVVESLKARLAVVHGGAGRKFVQSILEAFPGPTALRAALKHDIDEQHQRLIAVLGDGRVLGNAHKRALRYFAFLIVGGIWAEQAGVLPYDNDKVIGDCEAMARAWLNALPPLTEGDRAVNCVRDYVLRFRGQFTDADATALSDEYRPPLKSYGITRKGLLLLSAEQFEEACRGMNVLHAKQSLRDQGILKHDIGKLGYRVVLPEMSMKGTTFTAIVQARLFDDSELDSGPAAVVPATPVAAEEVVELDDLGSIAAAGEQDEVVEDIDD